MGSNQEQGSLSRLLQETESDLDKVKANQMLDFALSNVPTNLYKDNPLESFLVSRLKSKPLTAGFEQLVGKLDASLPRLYQELEMDLSFFCEILQLPQGSQLGSEEATNEFFNFLIKAKNQPVESQRAIETANSISILVNKVENQLNEMESIALPFFSNVGVINEKVKFTRSSINPLPPSRDINLFSQLSVFLSLLYLFARLLQVNSSYELEVFKEKDQHKKVLMEMEEFSSGVGKELDRLLNLEHRGGSGKMRGGKFDELVKKGKSSITNLRLLQDEETRKHLVGSLMKTYIFDCKAFQSSLAICKHLLQEKPWSQVKVILNDFVKKIQEKPAPEFDEGKTLVVWKRFVEESPGPPPNSPETEEKVVLRAADHYSREADSTVARIEYMMESLDVERSEMHNSVEYLLENGISDGEDLNLVQVSHKMAKCLLEKAEDLEKDISGNLSALPPDSLSQWKAIYKELRELAFKIRRTEQSGETLILLRKTTDTFNAKETARATLPRLKPLIFSEVDDFNSFLKEFENTYFNSAHNKKTMFIYLKDATRSLPQYVTKGYNDYDLLLEALKKNYGGKNKLLSKIMENLFKITIKRNSELICLKNILMSKRQLVEIGYSHKLDRITLLEVVRNCFSNASLQMWGSTMAEKEEDCLEMSEENFAQLFWNFVTLRERSLSYIDPLKEKSRGDLDGDRLRLPSGDSRRERDNPGYKERDSYREYGSKTDRAADKSLLNFTHGNYGCRFNECKSDSHRTHQCPKLVGKSVEEALENAKRSGLCVACLLPNGEDQSCPTPRVRKDEKGETVKIVFNCPQCHSGSLKINRNLCRHASRGANLNNIHIIEKPGTIEKECQNRIFDEGDVESKSQSESEDQSSYDSECYYY